MACLVAAANLGAVMGLDARVVKPATEPPEAYLPVRGQYNAEALLAFLAESDDGVAVKVGVTERDICLPVLAYVYGEAYVGGGVALVSLYRLGKQTSLDASSQDLLLRRLTKVVCHETAHALGLTHCHHPRCVMHFAGGLEALDHIKLGFCPACRSELDRRRSALEDRLRNELSSARTP